MLGARYEFLTMRKVISGRKQFRKTHDLEKGYYFVEIYFSTFLIILTEIFLKKFEKFFFWKSIQNRQKRELNRNFFLVSLRYLSNDFWPYLKRTT